MSGDIFGCHIWEGTALASGGQRPGMLRDIQYIRQTPQHKHLAQKVSNAEAEGPWSKGRLEKLYPPLIRKKYLFHSETGIKEADAWSIQGRTF